MSYQHNGNCVNSKGRVNLEIFLTLLLLDSAQLLLFTIAANEIAAL